MTTRARERNMVIDARDIAYSVWLDGTVAVYRGWSRGRAESVGVYDSWREALRDGSSGLTDAPRVTVHPTIYDADERRRTADALATE